MNFIDPYGEDAADAFFAGMMDGVSFGGFSYLMGSMGMMNRVDDPCAYELGASVGELLDSLTPKGWGKTAARSVSGRRAVFRELKRSLGIPTSSQGDMLRRPDKHNRQIKLREWRFMAGDGTKYRIRDDQFGMDYPPDGKQGPHFNWGVDRVKDGVESDLKEHAYYYLRCQFFGYK